MVSRRTFILATVMPAFLAAIARADGDAIAIVNGNPISKQRLTDLLIESHGLDVLQQLVLLEVAKAETKKRGIRVTTGDADREFDETLNQIAAEAGLSGSEATEENKRKALQTMLDNKRISQVEFRIGMERNAHLRKLVEIDLKISESLMRAEFARVHGQRRAIRHIQINARNSAAINDAMNQLQKGTDFAEVARRLSEHPDKADGGLMAPFAFDSPELDIPAAMREAAFTLELNGVSTPIIVGQYAQIIRLEQIVEPENVRFEDVRSEIERSLRDRVMKTEMQRIQIELFDKANVSVMEPNLKKRYAEFLEKRDQTSGKP